MSIPSTPLPAPTGPDASLRDIAEKVESGARLSREDGLRLYASPDLHEIGRLANVVRERKHGNAAYFVINRHINYSNVCVDTCLFCAFARRPGEEGGYLYTMDEMVRKAEEARAIGATEIHIVGGLHPDLPFAFYTEMLATLHARFPEIHLKAFTAVEIAFFAEKFGMTVEDVLGRLRASGLGSLPGGGAEILAERVRKKLCRDKIDTESWLGVHRTAHRMGIRSNATMLYGHIERDDERIEHMIRIRDLQDETGGFLTFIPLSFHPENTFLEKLPKATGTSDLRNIAISRLMVDNVDHVKAYWTMTGLPIAQIALAFGADDMDGTVIEEKITHMAGGRSPQGVGRDDLCRLIREAGREPVQRDTLYTRLDPVAAPAVA